MLRQNLKKFSYNDVTIIPEAVTTIRHRSECNPYVKTHQGEMLPIFAAPMTNVVDIDTSYTYLSNKITPIIPRSHVIEKRLDLADRGFWIAVSLQEFEDIYCSETKELPNTTTHYVLIDVANGHMQCILDLVKKAKKIHKQQLVVMAGNIANPKAYEHYYNAGIDYIRCSIGSGASCITASNTAIYMPQASLIDEIVTIKKRLQKTKGVKKLPLIVADGGIRNYSDVIKAIALGADYVMVGSLFAKALDSCSEKYFIEGSYKTYLKNYTQRLHNCKLAYGKNLFGDEGWFAKWDNDANDKEGRAFLGTVYASYYGMASKKGQIDLQGEKTKTSEGTEKELTVTYRLSGWVSNMADYLRSAMSYTNSRTIDDLKESEVILISENAKNSYNS